MAKKMEMLRVQLATEKAAQVRQMAMHRFGYVKGAISKAVNEALDSWMAKRKKLPASPDWNKMEGVLSHVKKSSVELQHAMWDRD